MLHPQILRKMFPARLGYTPTSYGCFLPALAQFPNIADNSRKVVESGFAPGSNAVFPEAAVTISTRLFLGFLFGALCWLQAVRH